MWGGGNPQTRQCQLKTIRVASAVRVVGMEPPSAFWMIGDTVEILQNYLFICSGAFCRK